MGRKLGEWTKTLESNNNVRRIKFQKTKSLLTKKIQEGMGGSVYGSLSDYRKLVAEAKKVGPDQRRAEYLARVKSGFYSLSSSSSGWANRRQIGSALDNLVKNFPSKKQKANTLQGVPGKKEIENEAAATVVKRTVKNIQKIQETIEHLKMASDEGWLFAGENPFKFEGNTSGQWEEQILPYIETQAKLSWLLLRIGYNIYSGTETGAEGEEIQLQSDYVETLLADSFGQRDIKYFPYVGTDLGTDFLKKYTTFKIIKPIEVE